MENLQEKIQSILNLFKLKRFAEAELAIKAAIKQRPNNTYLQNLLGLTLINQNKLEAAQQCYTEGIKVNPNFAPFYDNLGTVYKIRGKYQDSKKYYIKSIKIDKKKPEPYNNLGNLYILLNENQKAITNYKQSIQVNSKIPLTHYNLALLYKSIGDFKKAIEHLKISIKLNKYLYSAHRALSEMLKYNKNDEHYNNLRSIYLNEKIKHNYKTEIIFALAKAEEDCKDFNNAFKYYKEANNLRRKEVNFSLNNEKKLFQNIKNNFNKDFFDKLKKSGNKDSSPIFILGMPRSGTTLVEQIISSHPQVYGGDELRFMTNIVNENFADKDNLINFDKISNFSNIDYVSLGK